MNKRRLTLTWLGVVAVVVTAWSVNLSRATGASPVLTDVNIRSEAQTLDAFVKDLVVFNRKAAQLNKRGSITKEEFGALQRNSDDLKLRLSGLQNALREIVRKLKAAGQWDDLDEKVSAKISDPSFQELARENSFKRTLEEFSSDLTSKANEISAPLENLKLRVTGRLQEPNFGAGETPWRFTAVSYGPEPLKFRKGFHCRVSWLHYGIHGAFGDGSTEKDRNDIKCFCYDDTSSCDFLNN